MRYGFKTVVSTPPHTFESVAIFHGAGGFSMPNALRYFWSGALFSSSLIPLSVTLVMADKSLSEASKAMPTAMGVLQRLT